MTPQDILDYELPTHPLQEVDVKRAKDALKNDPFFKAHKPWIKAIDQLVSMGVRAEQQALAKWGLNFVIERVPAREAREPEELLAIVRCRLAVHGGHVSSRARARPPCLRKMAFPLIMASGCFRSRKQVPTAPWRDTVA